MSRSGARFGTFEELIADVEPEVAALARQLRELVLDVHPEAVEVVRLGDRAATYGVGPKKMSEGHTYIMPQAGYVNLGFYYGASLPDPAGLLAGSGKKLRHVKVRSAAAAAAPPLRRLVEAALAERREALGRA